MTRSVYDIAVSPGITAGVDPADDATKKSAGKFEKDYTKYLDAKALKGARSAVARDVTGADPDVDWAFEAALKAMQRAGATLIDVKYLTGFLDQTGPTAFTPYPAEFAVQIGDYPKTTGPGSIQKPRAAHRTGGSLQRSAPDRRRAEPVALAVLQECGSQGRQTHGLSLHRLARPLDADEAGLVEGMFARNKLNLLVYPTGTRRVVQIMGRMKPAGHCEARAHGHRQPGPVPGLWIVPVGSTMDDLHKDDLPFTGAAFSVPKACWRLDSACEQATRRSNGGEYAAAAGAIIDVPEK